MMRRFHEALLLAVLLVAVQTVILAHGHDDGASGGLAAQGCEFCAGHQAGAPAPEAGGPAHSRPRSTRIPLPQLLAARTGEVRSANLSRAPPAFRPV